MSLWSRLGLASSHQPVPRDQEAADAELEATFGDDPRDARPDRHGRRHPTDDDGDESGEGVALVGMGERRSDRADEDGRGSYDAPADERPYDRPSSPAPDYEFLRPPGSVPAAPRQPAGRSWRDRLSSALALGTRYDALGSGHAFTPGSLTPRGGPPVGTGLGNDGVFANLVAKPERRQGDGIEYVGGDDDGTNTKEMPPTYEAAAADAAPPYWETTIVTPSGLIGPDDILVDGLPVGNLFSFLWSLLVSVSFQFVGASIIRPTSLIAQASC